MRGPILKYFIETMRTTNRTQFIERFCRTAAAAHEFFISQFERIERKIGSEHERTRQRIAETNGLVLLFCASRLFL